MKIEKAEFKGKNRWQRLTKQGKGYVIFSFVILVIIEIGVIANWPKPIPTVNDPKPQTIKVPVIIHDIRTIKEKTQPLIYVCQLTPAKTKYGDIYDTLQFTIYFCNKSKDDAYNFTSWIFLYVPDIGMKSKQKADVTEKMAFPTSSTPYFHRCQIVVRKEDANIDSCYVEIKGNYENERRGIDEIVTWNIKKQEMFFAPPRQKNSILKIMRPLPIVQK